MVYFFFFNHKTSYELRISDWSSDVCSSDLIWVPTNYRLTPPEVAYLASSSGAKAMICDDAFAQHADTARAASAALEHRIAIGTPRNGELAYEDLIDAGSGAVVGAAEVDPAEVDRDRTEEHTSELQSLMRNSYSVSCV